MKDDPARHERLAAIGKNGAPIRLHKVVTLISPLLNTISPDNNDIVPALTVILPV